MPPNPAWFRGREAVAAFLGSKMAPGGQRMVLVEGADAVAFAFYRRDGVVESSCLPGDGPFTARAIEVTVWEDGLVREIHAFFDRALVERWGVPSIAR
jgi:hypothetical protein